MDLLDNDSEGPSDGAGTSSGGKTSFTGTHTANQGEPPAKRLRLSFSPTGTAAGCAKKLSAETMRKMLKELSSPLQVRLLEAHASGAPTINPIHLNFNSDCAVLSEPNLASGAEALSNGGARSLFSQEGSEASLRVHCVRFHE